MSDSSLLEDDTIIDFDDDGIPLKGYKMPVLGTMQSMSRTHQVWEESTPTKKFFLVYIHDIAGGKPFTYHSQAESAKKARIEAKDALVARATNLNDYPAHVRELMVWLRSVNPTFTIKDAQDAGFCMLGVQMLFAKYGYSDTVSGHEILSNMSPDGEDFIEPPIGAMVYSV